MHVASRCRHGCCYDSTAARAHRAHSALSQSAANVGTVADGESDGATRDRAASCRTGARSAVIAVAAVHGRKRMARCPADLQIRMKSKQSSRSAARARPDMNTNRLTHREHRLVRTASSNRLEELQDGGGARPAAPANQGSMRSPTAASWTTGPTPSHSPQRAQCDGRVALSRLCPQREPIRPWCHGRHLPTIFYTPCTVLATVLRLKSRRESAVCAS